ncbi:MAG: ABC transporter permease [Dehalococcoidia bacterium]
MTKYIIRRLLLLIPTLLILTLALSAGIRFLLPGDVVDILIGEGGYEEIDRPRLEKLVGIDKSWPQQYGEWVGGILTRFDFGDSLKSGRAITDELRVRLPITLEFSALAMFFSLLISIPVGIISAVKQDTPIDYLTRSFAIGALAIPGFWLATLVVVWPSKWGWYTPPLTYVGIQEDPWANIKLLWVPALLLGVFFAGSQMRMTRSMMLEVLRQDYIRTAWAKGLRERVVVMRHALKNALIPVVTIVGLQIPVLIGGAVVFETIFVIPGIGRFLLQAINDRDWTALQSINLVLAAIVLFSNLVVDLFYTYLDPRIRLT